MVSDSVRLEFEGIRLLSTREELKARADAKGWSHNLRERAAACERERAGMGRDGRQ